MRKSKFFLSADQQKETIELYLNRVDTGTIGKKFNVSTEFIYNFLNKIGVYKGYLKPITKEELEQFLFKGLTAREIAEETGISKYMVHKWIKYYQINLTPQQKQPTQKIFASEETLRNYIIKGYTIKRIAQIYDVKSASVLQQLNKYNLKTKGSHKKKYTNQNKIDNLNWKEIQEFHEQGNGYKEISKKYNVAGSTIAKAKQRKLIKFLSKQESQERIEKNHNKIPYWNQKNQKSLPCEYAKKILEEMNIDFQEEFAPLKHLKRYFRIDIAFPDKKIGIEINGNQHYNQDKKTLTEHFQNRHDLIEKEGWILYEIYFKKAFNRPFMLNLYRQILNVNTQPFIEADFWSYQQTLLVA